MNQQKYFDFVEEKLSILAFRIERRGKLNDLNLHIRSEIFYCDFFNLLFEWNLNKTKNHNESGIDLIDKKNKIVISVSATATKKKIQHSLNNVSPDYLGYNFKFISISKSASSLRKKPYSAPYNLVFNPNEDIYDIDKILKIISTIKLNRLKEIYDFFEKVFGNGVNSTPDDRLNYYLNDSNNWKYKDSTFYYEKFPEFTLVENNDFDKKYDKPWISRFPDKFHTSESEYLIKYHTTTLAKVYLVCCDGGRFIIAKPQVWWNESPNYYHYTYYFIKDSIEYLVEKIVTTVEHKNNCREPSIYKEFEVFESKEEADQLIKTDFSGGMSKYIYYNFDKEELRYLSRIEKGISTPIKI